MGDDNYLRGGTTTTNIINEVLGDKKSLLFKPATEVFSKKVDIKKFYNDLHDLLVNLKFTDVWSPDGDYLVKAGEWVDNKERINRNSDMFEVEHVVVERGWAKEFEFKWKFKKNLPESDYGSMEFELYLVVRDMKDVEFLDKNNNKIKTQIGKWEFRNKMEYKNTVNKNYLDKIPFVKGSPFLKKVYLDRFYQKNLENDINTCFKLKGKIYELIHSYFR
ncbi:MAG: hypothetical protein PF569_07515 [Candidatus Woesearchaeota archaeon]|jgi:hypothetical protein|nr:hypothetical protein [Candidatus Woesearchaeota archaeon]